MVTFKKLCREDFPLLAKWLSQPHVARWWNHDCSLGAVELDFGPTVDGLDQSDDYIAFIEERPVGFVQRCCLDDSPNDLNEIRRVFEVTEGTLTIDYLVGDPSDINRGLGTRLIRAFAADTWIRFPAAKALVVPVAAANIASWRVLEKAGFTRVSNGFMSPDNHSDDSLHFVYELVLHAESVGD